MRRLRKILIISSILSRFIIGFAVADDSDCGIFGIFPYQQEGTADNGFSIVDAVRETDNNPHSNFLTIDQQKAILTKNDLNTAWLNLKKYCCEKEIGGISQKICEDDKKFFNPNALDSPYLFDHIFDVMMRRLNGLTGSNDIYTQTNMTVDDKGQKRREWISDKAEDLSGSATQSIIDGYKKYWTKSNYDIAEKIYHEFPEDDDTFFKYVSGRGDSEESEQVATMIQDYDKWTLYDRYRNACALSEYFYALLLNQEYSKNKDKLNGKIRSCEKIVQTQINGESQYVQLVSQRASDLLLTNYIEGYVDYLYGRGNQLKSLWKNSTDRFLDVIRAVPLLVKQCVK